MTIILTIHGLGGSSFSHNFIRAYLQKYISKEGTGIFVESIDYNSTTETFESVIEKVENYISLHNGNIDEKFILIGHSLGGIIATHINHPKVIGAITISSPHTSCYFGRLAQSWLHEKITNYIFGHMYERLINPPEISKVPKIICITGSWNPWYKFDGRVYTDEMIHPQSCKVLHLEWTDHILQLWDIRMMRLIYEGVKEIQ